jgi:uncharacterized protein YegP (UPF0339 family)
LYENAVGEYEWRRKAPNGEILSRGEGFGRPADARVGALRANLDLDNSDVRWVD